MACIPASIRDGNLLADGYTDPSGSKMQGPTTPSVGSLSRAADRISIDPLCTRKSGLQTIILGALHAAIPLLAAAP